MKISTFILGASLSVNVAIVALLIAQSTSGPVSLPPTSASGAKGSAVSDPLARSGERSPLADLPLDDPAKLLDRLRAAGFPPHLWRAIVAAQVRQQFAPRRAALEARAAQQPFWEAGLEDPQLRAAHEEIRQEEDQALQAILGAEAKADEASRGLLRQRFPDWPEEKIAAVERAQKAHQERMREVRRPAEQFAAEKIAHEEVARLLSPEELDNYELRTSRDANTLRARLGNFEVSEQEFRTLFALQRAFDADHSPLLIAGLDPEGVRARNAAQQQLNEQIRNTLGDERYALYQRSADSNYQQTSRLVARLELPASTADQLYAMQQDVQRRAAALRADQTLTSEIRSAQLTALAAEAETKATAVLGPSGYAAYKQYGGSWLNAVQSRATPARIAPVTP